MRLALRLVVALVLAVPFFWRLGDEEFHGDESHWISSGQEAFALITTGRLNDPLWREQFYLYSQPQLGKLLIGAALAVAGQYGPTPIYDYDWQLRPEVNRATGRVPPAAAVRAGRVPGALAGWVSCLLLWAIGAQASQPRAGLLAALLLASHPLWLANARRAGLDATALCLGLTGTWAALQAVSPRERPVQSRPRRGGDRSWRWWLLAGLGFGLGLAGKYTALLMLPPAALAALVQLLWLSQRWRVLAGASLALATGAAVFYLSNPALYPAPLEGVRASIDFLATQARDMRHASPVFRSLPLVAAEIFDRTIWPTGFPAIVDHTLPEPLRPGSYGTPIVALGAAVALVVLLTRGRRAPHLITTGALWVAAVYVALTLSIPIWWERWHLPLVPALCLLGGCGLAELDRLLQQGGTSSTAAPSAGWRKDLRYRVLIAGLPAGSLLALAQYAAALALEPSFLGKGFGALLGTPAGALAHLGTLALMLAALVSHWLHQRCGRQRRAGAVPDGRELPLPGGTVEVRCINPAPAAGPGEPATPAAEGELYG